MENQSIPEIVPDKAEVEKYMAFLEEQMNGVQGINEAGGIAFTELYGKKFEKDADGKVTQIHVVKINVTGRGVTAIAAVKNLLACIQIAGREFHMYPWMPGSGENIARKEESAKADAARANPVAAAAAVADDGEPTYVPLENNPAPIQAGAPAGAVRKPAGPAAAKPAGPAKPAGAPKPAAGAPAAAEVGTEVVLVKSVAHAVTPNGNHYLSVKGGKYSKFGLTAWPEILPAEVADFETWAIGTTYAPEDYGWNGIFKVTTDGKKVLSFIPKPG